MQRHRAPADDVGGGLQLGQVLAHGVGELGVEVDAVLGLEDLGADGRQSGVGLGPVQDGGQLGPDAGGRIGGQQRVLVQGGGVVAVWGRGPILPRPGCAGRG
ncbi:hypothetical protein ACWGIU_01860 [Streptomyces sp. NPDC054840]